MMERQHKYLEKRFKWYRDWHHNGLHKFVHWFVLIIFVLAFVFDAFASLYLSKLAYAASPWSIDTQGEWNTGSYTNTDATAGGNLELTSQPTWYNSTAPTFYDSAYSYRRKITFDNSAQAENLVNFPVMVKATNDELNWSSIIQADLDDVIFVDSNNTTKLNWEWETKNSSGESIAWVQVSQVDASSSTDYIYMYYGNIAAVDQSNQANVWESNHHAVWHLNEPSGVLYDSTSNDIDLTPTVNNPLYGQTGVINGCLSWSGADIRVTKTSDVPASNRYTVEAWVKPGTQVSTYGYIADHASTDGNFSYALLVKGSDLRPMAGHSNSGGSGVFVTGTNPLSTTNWTHLAATYDGANVKLYVNGVYDNQVALPTIYTANPGRVTVGGYVSTRYVGLIDEPVVSYVARSDKWIAAEYKNQGPNTFTTFGAPQNSDSYSYRRKITFDNSAQAENLINFPVVVKANNSSLAWDAKIQADMDDVIFVDADDSTPLSFEWETEAPAGDSIAWVKVPQINASSAADYIYMYYGNGTTADHSHQKGVWDSNFKGVWHLKEDPSGTAPQVQDSTANNNDGTSEGSMTSEDQVSGQINGSLDFDGSDDYVNTGSSIPLDSNNWTIGGWFTLTTISGYRRALSYYGGGPTIWKDNNTGQISLVHGGTIDFNANIALAVGPWYHVVFTRMGSTVTAYLNGSQTAQNTSFAVTYTADTSVRIGNSTAFNEPWPGLIDEIRISSTARSANWIAAEYKNQTDIFNTMGSQQTQVEVTGTYSSIVKDMGFNTNLTLFSALATLGTGTATYFVRTGPTASVDGSWTGWVEVTPGSDPSATLDNNRYAQMKVDLTGDGATTPNIDSITLSYSSVPGSSVITSPIDGATFGAGDVNIAGTAQSNSGATLDKIEISTNGGTSWNDATGTDNWSYLFVNPSSGTYNLKSRAHNSDGVYEVAGAGITITIDADKPVSAISYPTTGGYYSPNLLVTGTSSDTGGGIVANLDIRITKQGTGVVKDWTAVTNTGTNFSTWTYSQDGLLEDDQTYLIETRATDNFGNVQTTFGSSTITIDLTYPSSNITSPKLNDKFKVEDRKIDGTATTNNGQALSKVDIRILKLSDLNLKTTADITGKSLIQDWTQVSGSDSWSYNVPASLFQANDGGYYQIQSRATNVVGLVESPNPGITILVDDKPPTIPSNPILQDATNYSEGINSIFLQFASSKDNETAVKEYLISVNGKESALRYGNPSSATQDDISLILASNQGVKEGNNSVSIKAKDEVDNASESSKSASVEIKKQTATITDIEIKNVTLVKKQKDDEKTSALVKYKTSLPTSTIVYWDETNPEGSGAEAYSEPSLNYTHTAILTGLTPDTNYKVEIQGIDEYGNKITSDVQSFKSTEKPEEESILHIILKALEDLFTWVKKVMAAPFSEKKDLTQETKDYLALKLTDSSSQKTATKTPLIAATFRKGSTLVKDDKSFTGVTLANLFNSNLQSQVLKTNILDLSSSVALDKSPEIGKKTIYKLDKINNSEKIVYPGKENEAKPEIQDIETREIITTKEKAEYLITFKTDIPTKTKLEAGITKQESEELDLSHSFYLDNLAPGDTINYKVTAVTQYDKTTESSEQSFTIPKQEEEKSIWRIIIDALISSFDWLKNLLK